MRYYFNNNCQYEGPMEYFKTKEKQIELTLIILNGRFVSDTEWNYALNETEVQALECSLKTFLF